MNKILTVFVMGVYLMACKQKELTLKDVAFLKGSWSSAGTDVFEKWDVKEQVIEGSSYRVINNVIQKVDSMTVKEAEGRLVMTVHIRYSKKNEVSYFSEFSKEGFIFKNDTCYPKQIAYSRQPASKNLIVMAGDDLTIKDKHFEFLFVPSDSL